jgi:hypothetical protein
MPSVALNIDGVPTIHLSITSQFYPVMYVYVSCISVSVQVQATGYEFDGPGIESR